MRKIVIAGNWKMHKSNSEAKELIEGLKDNTKKIVKTKIIVCPPYTALSLASELVKGSNLQVGAQNMYWEKEGAFTGEISTEMIISTGVSFVIIGHSERRQFFGETNETVNKKLKAALESGLKPIVCIGESLDERESGVTNDVVGKQVEKALAGIDSESMKKVILAYEPIWAIGTGKTATPQQAQDVHKLIRSILVKLFNNEVADKVVIQYGGSVKPDNASELLSQPDIDGALVGGACLKADSFSGIINAAEELN